jgi:Raf kinase inhibitor-like YbhB/YbcL family protein
VRSTTVGVLIATGLAGALVAGRGAGAFDRERTAIELSSSAFAEDHPLPTRFTSAGEGISPPLAWSGIPSDTKSLVLMMRDAAPRGGVHWLVYDIPPMRTGFGSDTAPADARVGLNDAGRRRYEAPCPPSAPAAHYIFSIHALDRRLDLDDADAASVRDAMAGHVLAAGFMVVSCGIAATR